MKKEFHVRNAATILLLLIGCPLAQAAPITILRHHTIHDVAADFAAEISAQLRGQVLYQ